MASIWDSMTCAAEDPYGISKPPRLSIDQLVELCQSIQRPPRYHRPEQQEINWYVIGRTMYVSRRFYVRAIQMAVSRHGADATSLIGGYGLMVDPCLPDEPRSLDARLLMTQQITPDDLKDFLSSQN